MKFTLIISTCVTLFAILPSAPARAEDSQVDLTKHKAHSEQSAKTKTDPYARFEKNQVRGISIRVPTPEHYVFQDALGARSAMADAGFLLYGLSHNVFTYDLLNGGKVRDRQVYAGQKATLVNTNYVFLTYDLEKIGLSGGQITASGNYTYTNWEPAGPTRFHIGIIQYHQSMFDRVIELSIGYLANGLVWNGTYVGGNLTSGTFGVSASIPQQTGLSNVTITRPGANLKINLGHDLYSLTGIQRSWNPAGSDAEVDANGIGFGWSGDHVGMRYMEELGFNRRATTDHSAVWLRAGAAYNTSGYASLKDPGKRENNYSLALLGDYQLLRLGRVASRGIYGGFTAMYAPPNVNRFSQYYELRFYAKMPFLSRPADSFSFVVNQNRFSKYAIQSAKSAGRMTVDETTSVSLSYTLSIVRGVFLTTGFGLINHPRAIASEDRQKFALNFTNNLVAYF